MSPIATHAHFLIVLSLLAELLFTFAMRACALWWWCRSNDTEDDTRPQRANGCQPYFRFGIYRTPASPSKSASIVQTVASNCLAVA